MKKLWWVAIGIVIVIVAILTIVSIPDLSPQSVNSGLEEPKQTWNAPHELCFNFDVDEINNFESGQCGFEDFEIIPETDYKMRFACCMVGLNEDEEDDIIFGEYPNLLEDIKTRLNNGCVEESFSYFIESLPNADDDHRTGIRCDAYPSDPDYNLVDEKNTQSLEQGASLGLNIDLGSPADLNIVPAFSACLSDISIPTRPTCTVDPTSPEAIREFNRRNPRIGPTIGDLTNYQTACYIGPTLSIEFPRIPELLQEGEFTLGCFWRSNPNEGPTFLN